MGLFGRKKQKNDVKREQAFKQTPTKSTTTKSTPESTPTKSPPVKKLISGNDKENKTSRTPKSKASTVTEEPTLDQLPAYCKDIQDGNETAARALRQLFTLSEHKSQNRNSMLKERNLVPTLLQFLSDCEKGSSEQYLALLVLNNISIPSENKRIIALECGGARMFARLLCEDPSSHLLAIILVNLTFCEAELRRELANPQVELVNCLSYALKLSSMTQVEFENYATLEANQSVSKELSKLMDEEKKLQPATLDLLLDLSDQVYPETARWSLVALKNLTRPSKNGQAAFSLVKSGVVPLIMKMITVGTEDDEEYINSPALWETNSMQDAALFCIMNLAATPETRHEIVKLDGVRILTMICEFEAQSEDQMDFQKVKARMALAYVLGSVGHFGQPRAQNTPSNFSHAPDSVIILSHAEAGLIFELLANTLQNRAKVGPGGYSAATFHVQWILFAIRCLLTHELNQAVFASACGPRLNVLLMKAIAEHSLGKSFAIDSEAAEYAVFCLYLQSKYGFKERFLPAIYGNQDKLNSTGSLAEKILTSYVRMDCITPPGLHAAEQLLLRLRYLLFQGSVSELATSNFPESVFTFDAAEAAESVLVNKRSHGARPQENIFDKAIVRGFIKAGNKKSLRTFSSALLAVEELSFGTSYFRHSEAIDDIMVANNIANAANGDETETYNFMWGWQGEPLRDLQTLKPNKSSSLFSYFSCGTMCAADTTEKF